MGLKFSGYLRGLMTSAALTAVVALAGCETDGLQSGRAMKELSAEMRAELHWRKEYSRRSRRARIRKPSTTAGPRADRIRASMDSLGQKLVASPPCSAWSISSGPGRTS